MTPTTAPAAAARPGLLRRAVRLEYLTVGWNIVEGLVVIAAERNADEDDEERIEHVERRAQQLVAGSLVLLAVYIAWDSITSLLSGERAQPSAVGIALAIASLAVMLVAVAAPLFALSGIGTLTLRTASADVRDRYLLPFHSRLVSALTFPVVGWVAFAGVMWGSHFSTLYNAALLDDGVHALEHLLYLVAACLFWWPLLSPDPLRWRIHPGAKLVALLAQMPPMSFIAVTIIGAPAPLYAAYLGRTDAFGIDALTDQRIAGSLMWVTGDLAFLIPGALLLARFARHEEEEAKRIDARLDRQRRAPSRKES